MKNNIYILEFTDNYINIYNSKKHELYTECIEKDIIKDNEDGFLVEAENISQFADKIILLIEDKEKRLQMGKNAKENVKRYLPQNIIEKWENLFTNLLK